MSKSGIIPINSLADDELADEHVLMSSNEQALICSSHELYQAYF